MPDSRFCPFCENHVCSCHSHRPLGLWSWLLALVFVFCVIGFQATKPEMPAKPQRVEQAVLHKL